MYCIVNIIQVKTVITIIIYPDIYVTLLTLQRMCLNDIDLAPFLSDSPPAPPDVWLEVTSGEAPDISSDVFKAHR